MKKTTSLFICILLVVLLFSSCRNKTPEVNTTAGNNTDVNTSAVNTQAVPVEVNAGTSVPSKIITEVTTYAVPDDTDKIFLSGHPVFGKDTGSDKTLTGFDPLSKKDFTPEDPNNTKGLSTKEIPHSFGTAKDGKPNFISVDSQNYFDKGGYKAVTYDNKTTEKVLYLTFDCGYENGNTGKILDVLKDKEVPAAFFCTVHQMKQVPELIARMIKEGHIVGNHSVNHPAFSGISRTKMAEELQGFDDYVREYYGYSSPFFRFPEGKYSDSALELVNYYGYTCVFWSVAYADWDIDNQKGVQYAFDTVTSRLHPGAVILLHAVSPDNAGALANIIDYAKAQGYTFRSLEQLYS